MMPRHQEAPNRRVAALLYDGVAAFEMGIVAEVFGLDRPEMRDDWYRFVTVSEDRGPLRATGGVRVIAEAGLERLAEVGTIVVPCWRTDGTSPSPAIKSALWAAYDQGTRLVSICSGAFLLAACGFLAGRSATTHWLHAEKLRELYPDIDVNADVLYVDEGQILTSAGSAAGVDLLLHIVRKDFGAKIANDVARRMVVPPHREGGQAQFIERPVSARAGSRLGPLLDAVRRHSAERWTVASMARRTVMSERTFIRRFEEATGMAPGEWVIATRVEAARFLLETTASTLDEIALKAGFGSTAGMRHHFRHRLGLTPSAYRARFAPPQGLVTGSCSSR
jgi:AraC family transcriptional regulator, transcriptional activator FtrA